VADFHTVETVFKAVQLLLFITVITIITFEITWGNMFESSGLAISYIQLSWHGCASDELVRDDIKTTLAAKNAYYTLCQIYRQL